MRSSVRQKNLAVSALPVLTIQSQQKNRYRNFVSLLSILKEMFYFQLKLKDDETLLDLLSPLKLNQNKLKPYLKPIKTSLICG